MKKKPYRTNEVGNPNKNSIVEVYKTGKDGKSQLECEGPWRSMKQKYGLSTFQYPYVAILIDDEPIIAKLPILPSSLSNYWEYHDTFKKTEDEIWEFETVLKANDKVTKGNEGDYYLMTFQQGVRKEVEALDYIIATIKELRDELKKVDEMRAEKQQEYTDMDKPSVSEDELPQPEENEEPL